jgi:hypothetical protein
MRTAFMSKEAAYALGENLFKNSKKGFYDYPMMRPVRYYSEITISAAALGRNDFFTSANKFTSNIKGPNNLGNCFFIGTNQGIEMYEAGGQFIVVASSPAELAKLLVTGFFSFNVEGRPVNQTEPLTLFARGNGITSFITKQITADANGMQYPQPGASWMAGQFHDQWGVEPEQKVEAYVEFSSAWSLTTATKFRLIQFGWGFFPKTAA